MLLPLVALLLFAQGESSWDRRERFTGDDLTQAKAELRRQDPTLEYFQALDKRPIDSVYSLLLVNAAPLVRNSQGTRPTPDFRRGQIGLFVVTGPRNQVYMVLDRYPSDTKHPWPSMEPPTSNAVYLHAFTDYGIYLGSTKYLYDLHTRRKTGKIEYEQMALKVSARGGGRLYYAAGTEVYPRTFRAIVTVEPREKAPPVIDVRLLKGEEPGTRIPGLGRKPVKEFALGGGRSLALIQRDSGPELDGIAIKSPRRDTVQYPVPVVDIGFQMKTRKASQRPLEIENRIGPYEMEGSTLWFANTFYDGEGMSGMGALGTFDARTRKYEMRYLPQIVSWSGSALRLDGDDVWVGLARRPEGAVYGGGLLRYNRKTRSVRTYPVKDVIYTIDHVGDALYLGTSHGLYMLRGEILTQYRFEPDERGRIHVVARHAIDGR
ncbi:MAG: hypothetical protein ABFD86_05715 [Bryobacteraceae bacterium]